jgi:hypothetical protein
MADEAGLNAPNGEPSNKTEITERSKKGGNESCRRVRLIMVIDRDVPSHVN